MQTKTSQDLRRLVSVAVFGAMAYVVMLFIRFPVGFLTLDVKDAVITLCGLYFGPVGALALGVLVPLLEMVTVSGTGVYGFLMNMLGTLSFALPASIIYRYRRTFEGAIVGIISSVCAMTATMMIANLVVTPYYMHVTAADVAKMIPTLLLPFNLVKAVLNAAIVLLLYKPLSKALRRAGFLHGREQTLPVGSLPPESEAAEPLAENEATASPECAKRKERVRSMIVTAVALVLIAASLLVIFLVLGGKFHFGFR